MNKSDIKVGGHYGARDNPRSKEPLQHVKVLESVRKSWKVEWIDPNPGLIDYLTSRQLVIEWSQRTKFLRDETRLEQLRNATTRTGWLGQDHPVTDAVHYIFESTGENDLFPDNDGTISGDPASRDRIAARANIEAPSDLHAFVDRHGVWHATFETGLQLARAFAAAEPNTVLIHIESLENQYEFKAREPGNAYVIPLLNSWRAAWALCRQWAGHENALTQRDNEILRLRQLLSETIGELRRNGLDDAASRLERKVQQG